MRTIRILALNIILVAIAILIASTAFLLDRFWAVELPWLLTLLAWPLIVLSAGIVIWAAFTLARFSGATGSPGDPTRKLVVKGPYAQIRNPIYCADAIIVLGLAFLVGSPSLLGFDLLYATGIDIYVSKVEEPILEERFGQEYIEYKKKVPKWIPRIL